MAQLTPMQIQPELLHRGGQPADPGLYLS